MSRHLGGKQAGPQVHGTAPALLPPSPVLWGPGLLLPQEGHSSLCAGHTGTASWARMSGSRRQSRELRVQVGGGLEPGAHTPGGASPFFPDSTPRLSSPPLPARPPASPCPCLSRCPTGNNADPAVPGASCRPGTHRAVAFDHFLLFLKPLEEVGERLLRGVQVCSQLVSVPQNLLDLGFGKLLLFLSLLLKEGQHPGSAGGQQVAPQTTSARRAPWGADQPRSRDLPGQDLGAPSAPKTAVSSTPAPPGSRGSGQRTQGLTEEPRPHLPHTQGLQPQPGHTRCPAPTETAAGRTAPRAGVRPRVQRPMEGPNLFAATAPDANSGPGQPEG